MKIPSIVIITGLSGSGKTVALRALEDSGYTCVDNLPPGMIAEYADLITRSGVRNLIAVGLDIREREFLGELEPVLPTLRSRYDLNILFLEADANVLLRRFKESRRPHPLVSDVANLQAAIEREKALLLALRTLSNRIIDTSSLNPHQLRKLVQDYVRSDSGRGDSLEVTLMSFGFKHGVPMAVDLMFDVRFMPNPYFVEGLSSLTGRDEAVRNYVFDSSVSREFMERLGDFLAFLLPRYRQEGRAYLTIGFGCTGGHHRSVSVVEVLSRRFESEGLRVSVVHREL